MFHFEAKPNILYAKRNNTEWKIQKISLHLIKKQSYSANPIKNVLWNHLYVYELKGKHLQSLSYKILWVGNIKNKKFKFLGCKYIFFLNGHLAEIRLQLTTVSSATELFFIYENKISAIL